MNKSTKTSHRATKRGQRNNVVQLPRVCATHFIAIPADAPICPRCDADITVRAAARKSAAKSKAA